MKGIIFFAAILLALSFAPGLSKAAVKVQWFGQSCFLLTSPAGLKIVTDPFSPEIGYPEPELRPDLALVTHEHYDHNYVQMAKGNPEVFHGLNPKTQDYNLFDVKFKDTRIYDVAALHYESEAEASRGKDTIMVIEMPGLRLAHLGDLGRPLTEAQIKKIGRVDVLLIPVGSVYTIDAKGADTVISQLNPRLVFPMHYKTPALNIQLEGVDKFLAGKNNVVRVKGNEYTIDKLPEKQEIIVLDYR